MSQILALDLGTNTGWALYQQKAHGAGYTVLSGTIDLRGNRFQGGGMRFLNFQRWLEHLRKQVNLDVVYFEEVRRHLGTDAAHIYGGFLAILTAWCEAYELPCQGVHLASIKKHITGKGNASKQEVINAIKAKGYQPQNHDEADALALLELMIHKPNKQHITA
jgi:crossover junction endodeoxyribonuclease RuvC